MHTLRTPDDRFAACPTSRSRRTTSRSTTARAAALRVHHLDEGPADAEPVLLMHGEPSWCFLYRHMIPMLVEAGLRCVAPDLVGFGRSDKPAEQSDYTYARHVEWMRAGLFDELDLHDVTLVGRTGAASSVSGWWPRTPTASPGSSWPTPGCPPATARRATPFLAWQRFSQEADEFPVGGIVNGGCTTDLAPEVVAAYDAPFPDDSYKAGARIFPALVPTRPRIRPRRQPAAWESSAIRPAVPLRLQRRRPGHGRRRARRSRGVPGAGPTHTTIVGGGHFLQEDKGPELAARGRRLRRLDARGGSPTGVAHPGRHLVSATLGRCRWHPRPRTCGPTTGSSSARRRSRVGACSHAPTSRPGPSCSATAGGWSPPPS